jgi:hypothetical protein
MRSFQSKTPLWDVIKKSQQLSYLTNKEKQMKKAKRLVEFIENRHGIRCGCLVADIIPLTASEKETKIIFFGWSLCNINAGDKFTEKEGFRRANDRMLHSRLFTPEIPDSLKENVRKFRIHAFKHFIDADSIFDMPKVMPLPIPKRVKVCKENITKQAKKKLITAVMMGTPLDKG